MCDSQDDWKQCKRNWREKDVLYFTSNCIGPKEELGGSPGHLELHPCFSFHRCEP